MKYYKNLNLKDIGYLIESDFDAATPYKALALKFMIGKISEKDMFNNHQEIAEAIAAEWIISRDFKPLHPDCRCKGGRDERLYRYFKIKD